MSRKGSIGVVALAVLVGIIGLRATAGEADKATVGQAAPAFGLEDQNGKTVNLADHKGKIVVLEWINPVCPFVVRHYDEKTMQNLAAKYKDNDVVWLAVNSTSSADNAANKKWVEKYGLEFPILNDQVGQVGKAYGATNTPHMFIMDKAGNIVYSGAIDDDPRGNKAERLNYVDKALSELIAGKTITTPQTKAYGCTVKYAK